MTASAERYQTFIDIDPDPFESSLDPGHHPDPLVTAYLDYLACAQRERGGALDDAHAAEIVTRIRDAHATRPAEDCDTAWAEARLRWRLLHGTEGD